LICKLEFLFEEPRASATLTLIVVFVLMCLLPFHVFYLRSRKELLRVLSHIFVSPFGTVKFKHFFLADIITSLGVTLKDMVSIFFLFGTGQWLNLAEYAKIYDREYKPKPGEVVHQPYFKNDTLVILQLSIAFLPFWFRLMQCFRRYYDTKLNANLKNAGKYFTSMCVQGAAIFFFYRASNLEDMNYTVFYSVICVNAFSTCYSLYWDLYMDWGLFRSSAPGKRYLRHKLLYPAKFYYFAAATNTIMRLMWILPIFKAWYRGTDFEISQSDATLIAVVEALRRTQWALLRIENENVNNFEKYRNVLLIPEFKDMVYST
jgi:hypothetical protein